MKQLIDLFIQLLRSETSQRFFALILLFCFLVSGTLNQALAGDAPQSITLDGQLFDSLSSDTPLVDPSVVVDIKIYDPTKSCVLYEETQTLDTTQTNGRFNIQVGSATTDSKRATGDSHNAMATIFQNRSVMPASCGSYTPTAGDKRYLRITVSPSTTGSVEILGPDSVIDSVPNALVAESLQGLDRDHVLQTQTVTNLTQANAEAVFSNTNYPKLISLLGGTSGSYVSIGTDGGATIPTLPTAPAMPTAGQIWFDSSGHSLSYFDGTSVKTVGAAGSGITALNLTSDMTANGTAGGSVSSGATLGLAPTGVTAGTYTKLTVDVNGRVSTGATLTQTDIPILSSAGKVVGDALTSGTIAGTTAINTSGNITTSGTFTANAVSSTSTSTNGLYLYGTGSSSAHKITVLAPTLTTDYQLILPATAGTMGYALTTDGSGNLSWTSSAAGSVTSVGLVLPSIFSVTTPTVTSSGTLTAALMNQNASLIFAGPLSGSPAAAPTFRGLASSDLPVGGYDTRYLQQTLASANIWVGNSGGVAAAVNPSGDLAMDASGLFTLISIRGKAIDTTLPSATGQVMRWDNSGAGKWTPAYLSMADIHSTVSVGNTIFPVTSCTADKTLYWASLTDTFSCQSIGIADAQITYGTRAANLVFAGPASGGSAIPTFRGLSSADLPLGGYDSTYFKQGGSSFGTTAVLGTLDNNNLAFGTNGTNRMVIMANGSVGIGTTSVTAGALVDFNGTGSSQSALVLPRDTTALRPVVGVNGMIRYNTFANKFEVYEAGSWTNVATGAVASSGYLNGGNSFGGVASLGTNDSYALGLKTGSTVRVTIDTSGNVGVGTATPNSSLDMSVRTDAVSLPSGTLAQRPGAGVNGMIRYNSSVQKFEVFEGGAWGPMTASAASGFVNGGNSFAGPTSLGTNDANALSLKTNGVNQVVIGVNGAVGVGTASATAGAILDVNGTGALSSLLLPRDSTLNRPSVSVNGMIRYNNTANKVEVYENGAWVNYATSAAAAAAGVSGAVQFSNGSGGFLADAANYVWDNVNKRLGLGTATPTAGTIADFNGTGAAQSSILLPRDIVGNRPTVGVNGMLRYNSSTNVVETYANGAWSTVATGLATSNYLALVGGTMTGAIANASGSAAAPSLTFSVDPSTGVYTTGAGNLSLATSGVQRVAISNTGSIGVGTSSATAGAIAEFNGSGVGQSSLLIPRDSTLNRPTAAVNGMIRYNNAVNKFEVYENGNWTNYASSAAAAAAGATGAIQFSNGSGGFLADAVNYVWDNTGKRLGLGTATPTAGTIADFNGTGASQSSILLPRDAVGNRPTVGVNGMIRYNTSNASVETYANGSWTSLATSTTVGAYLPLVGGTMSGSVVGYNGTATAPAFAFVDKTTGLYSTGAGGLTVATAGVARMSFDSSGSVGVGTAAPGATLDVYGTGSASAMLIPRDSTLNRPTAAVNGMIRYNNNVNKFEVYENGNWTNYASSAAAAAAGANGAIQFSNGSGGFLSDAVNYVWDNTAKRLGLGTATPTAGTIADFNGTGASLSSILLPRDIVGNRPTVGVNGMLRYNSSTNVVETYANGAWSTVATGLATSNYLALVGGTMTGAIAHSSGTAAAPSMAFSVDPSSGVYATGAGNVSVATAGVQRLAISNTGSVGVGTSAATAGAIAEFNGSGVGQSSLLIPRDSTLNRPTAAINGMIRYNNVVNKFEVYENGQWTNYASSAAAAAAGATGAVQFSNGSGGFLADVVNYVWDNTNKRLGLGTATPTAGTIADFNGTGASQSSILLPRDIAGNRPTVGVNGMIRYNTSNASVETYANNAWTSLATSTTVGAYLPLVGGTVSGAIVGYNGTAAAPSLAFADKTTGLFSTGAGNLSVATSGVARVTVDTSGNVGVGTATPGATLDVSGTGAQSAMLIPRDSTTNRPTAAVNGMIRYNNIVNKFEVYENGNWTNYASSASAAAAGATGAIQYSNGSGGFLADAANYVWDAANKRLGLGTATPTAGTIADFNGTGASQSSILLPRDIVGNRPTVGVNGMLRYNSSTNVVETYANGAWSTVATGLATSNYLALVGGTMTGAIANASGTAAAPSLTFSADQTTGVYTTGAGNLSVATSGAQRLAISNTGSIGVGTASATVGSIAEFNGTGVSQSSLLIPRDATGNRPVAAVNGMIRYNNTVNKFEVYENGQWTNYASSASAAAAGATGAIQFSNGSGGFLADAINYVWDNAGKRLGLGTATPTAGTIADFNGTGASQSSILLPRDIVGNRPTVGVNGMIRYNTSNASVETYANNAWTSLATTTTVGAYLPLVGGTVSGAIVGYNGTAAAPALAFNDKTTGLFSTGAGNLSVATSGVSRVTVDSSGNVGVGTATPGATLDVSGTGAQSAMLIPRDSTTNRPTAAVNGMIRYNNIVNKFEVYENGNWTNYASSASATAAGATGAIQFSNGSGGFLADAVNYVWDNTGKRLGLGTATPTAGTIADFNGTGASQSSILLPRDIVGNRPTVGVNGMLRYNSSTNVVETYANGTWSTVATGNATSNYLALVGGTMTGAIAHSSGTAAAPSMAFSVDASTGVYTTGAGNVSIATAGVQRLAISNTGSVGVGTSAATAGAIAEFNGSGVGQSSLLIPRDVTGNRPVAAVNGMIRYNNTVNKFEVYENGNWTNYASSASAAAAGATGAIQFSNGSGGFLADAVNYVWDNAGKRLGLGTATPTAGTIADFNGTGASQSSILLPRDIAGNRPTVGVNGMIRYNTSNASVETYANNAWTSLATTSTVGAYLPLAGGTVSGAIVGYNGTAAAPALAFADKTTGLFSTGAGNLSVATSGVSRVTVDSSGNVGVGTATPGATLDVSGTGAQSAMLIPRDSTTNRPTAAVNGMIRYNNVVQKFEVYENGNWTNYASSASAAATGANGAVQFSNGSGGFLADAANYVWDNTGKRLGLGTATPTAGTIADFNGTGASQSSILLPRDIVGNRPTVGVNGMIRYNTSNASVETYANNAWTSLATTSTVGNYLALAGGTMTGAIANANGSAATPSLTFSADQTTGVYTTGAGNLSFATTGVQRLAISNTGTVGVGTSAATIGSIAEFNGTGVGQSSLLIPRDATGNRPVAAVNGMIRYNNTVNKFEVYENGQWTNYASSASAAAAGANGAVQFSNGSGGFLADAVNYVWDNAGKRLGLGTATPTAGTIADFNGTGATQSSILLPRDIVGNRPTVGVNGMIRYNTSNASVETYANNAWTSLATSTTVGAYLPLVGGTVSGAIVGYNGTAAAPALAFADKTTGLFSTGAGNLSVATSGVSRVTVDTSGNVGVGTATPGATLDVSGTGAQSAMLIPRDSTTNRPTAAVNGMIRYNNVVQKFEVYENGNWTNYASSASAAAAGASGAIQYSNGSGGFLADAVNYVWDATNKRLGLGTATPTAGTIADFNGTGASQSSILLPRDIVGNRPTVGVNGMIRYNTSNASIETYANNAWTSLATTSTVGNYLALAGGTMTGAIAHSSGTAAAPSMAFSVDQTTGVYTTGAGNLSLATAGVQRLAISNTGTVGVGTSNATVGSIAEFNGTGVSQSSLLIPRDATGNRPVAAVNGMIRYNNTVNKFEVYENGQWTNYASSASAAAAGATGAIQFSNGSGGFLADAVNYVWDNAGKRLGLGTATPTAGTIADFNGTGASQSSILLLRDIVGNRPTVGVNGMIRYNTSNASVETYANNAWTSLATTSTVGAYLPLVGGTVTGSIVGYNGTAAAPALAFNDKTTGLFSTGAGNLSVATSGISRVTVDSSGNVGVGTATPGATLDVSGTGAQSAMLIPRDSTTNRPTAAVNGMIRYNNIVNKFEVYENGQWTNYASSASAAAAGATGAIQFSNGSGGFLADAVNYVWDNAGKRLGLGTATPTAGTIADFNGTGASESSILLPRDIVGNRPTIGVNGMIRYNTSNASVETYANNSWTSLATSTTVGAYLPLVGGTVSGAIVGYNGTAAAPALAFADKTTGLFSTGAGNLSVATSGVARITVDTSGNVGVGTATPGATFDVSGTGAQSAMLIPRDSTSNRPTAAVNGMIRYNNVVQKFEVYENGNWTNYASSASAAATGANGAVQFSNGSGGFLADAVNYIWDNTNKRLGLGTATPTAGTIADFNGTGASQSSILLPRDIVGNRPTVGVNGMIRYNTSNASVETYANNAWTSLATTSTVGNYLALVGGTMTGAIAHSSGTAAAPSMAFSVDQTTGVYTTGAGNLSLATAGVQRLAISNTGTIGVGTSAATVGSIAEFNGTGVSQSSLLIPRDATGNRPVAAVNGMIRYNNTVNKFEVYENGQWTNYASSASAAAAGATGAIQFSNGSGGFLADAVNYVWDNTNKRLGLGTATPTAGTIADFNGTGAAQSSILLPRDVVGNRPTVGVNGMIRYNTSNSSVETYANNAWTSLATTSTVGAYLPLVGGTMSGAVVGFNGTVAAPAFAFLDKTTGLYSTGSGNLTVGTLGQRPDDIRLVW